MALVADDQLPVLRRGRREQRLVDVVVVVVDAKEELGEGVEVVLDPVAERGSLLGPVGGEHRVDRPDDRHLRNVAAAAQQMAQPADVLGDFRGEGAFLDLAVHQTEKRANGDEQDEAEGGPDVYLAGPANGFVT